MGLQGKALVWAINLTCGLSCVPVPTQPGSPARDIHAGSLTLVLVRPPESSSSVCQQRNLPSSSRSWQVRVKIDVLFVVQAMTKE